MMRHQTTIDDSDEGTNTERVLAPPVNRLIWEEKSRADLCQA